MFLFLLVQQKLTWASCGNVADNWRRWLQQFNLYMNATGRDGKDEKIQYSTFLTIAGEDALEIYNTFTFEEAEANKVKPLIKKFEAYCNPRKNVTYERHKFNTRCQEPDEKIDRDLNKAIKREHYPMKTIEEVATKLSGAKYFSTLDASAGFWHIKLDDNSSNLTTFNTPFGRYKFNRMPFGINSAPEVFQRRMSQAFEDIEGCDEIVDDILIWGRDEKEHNDRLAKVLKRARAINLKLNKEKSKILRDELSYIGHIITAEGVKPDPDKVKGIAEMKVPTDIKELQRFMGMVNYLGKFLPNLSNSTQALRELLQKETAWHWDERHDHAFQDIKVKVTDPHILKYYDVNKPVTVSVDASSYGLGACLLQEGHLISYASRSLNDAEKNYAQIEKELLAVVYGCTKYHQYIYGKQVEVETDHKPLEYLFKKPLTMAPPRLQRMMLQLQKYDLLVGYKPGKSLYIADTLSRAQLQTSEEHQRTTSKSISPNIYLLLKEN
ncbi:hypothetical protein QZH41_005886 [Actinostola sp. cb2023]|nr:hypothetical protein QZH41_005886 [Actinostola sp. cb2023]